MHFFWHLAGHRINAQIKLAILPPRKRTRACAIPSFAAGRSNNKPSDNGAGPRTPKSAHNSSKNTGHQPSFL